MGAPIGDEFILGEQVEYVISPINLAGLDLPDDFTFTVVVYVEGGDPTLRQRLDRSWTRNH